MNKFFRVVAVAAAGVAVALLAPTSTWAACPGAVGIYQCVFSSGGVQADPANTGVGGTFWVPGQGLDAIGPGDTTGGFGNDGGQLAGFPIPVDGSSFITDFGIGGGILCLAWDWFSFGSDGCAAPGAVTAAVLRDSSGNFAVMQVGDSGGLYDFDSINNGGTSWQGGIGNGVTLAKAMTISSSSDLGGTVDVTVAPLNLDPGVTVFDDQGGARGVPGTARLRGRQGGLDATVANGNAGGTFNVDADSTLCWELVDGGYSVTLGCREIGGNTPSQNVINGKAGFAKGGATFSWDVTAQFDVLGFNIYQKNVTKGSERKINDGLIPISGDNDATAEAYSYVAPRSDLRAWKGGFEIELVRQNGETSRAPVSIVR